MQRSPDPGYGLQVPFVLQGLIAQRGHMLRLTAFVPKEGVAEEEAVRQVIAGYEPFLKALDEYLASHT